MSALRIFILVITWMLIGIQIGYTVWGNSSLKNIGGGTVFFVLIVILTAIQFLLPTNKNDERVL